MVQMMSRVSKTQIDNKIDYYEQIASEIVSGAAVTSIQFTGLDLDTDGHYLIRLFFTNATGSDSAVYLEVNGDTTLTNYYNQALQAAAAGASAARINSPQVGFMKGAAGKECIMDLHLYKKASINPYCNVVGTYTDGGASTIILLNKSWVHNNTTNVTSIELVGSVASSIAIGSHVTVYKVT
jgi:hypothetical protein